MTRTAYPLSRKAAALCKGVAVSALLCLLAVPAAQAQEQTGGQQLPDNFAQQQIPPAFPADNVLGGGAPAEAPQTSAQTNAPAAETASQNSEGATQPAANEIPAQPAQRKLVPATAMGKGASTEGQPSGAVSPTAMTGNSVEDAALAAEQSAPPAPTSVLDRYAAEEEPVMPSGDALPQVDNTTMVTLQTEGFGNAAAKRTTVAVDGSVIEGKSPEELQEEIRSEAFDAAITGMFPLQPDQIETLLKQYDKTQRAVQSPTFSNPKPEVSVQNISLDPGAMPPVIKTAVGNVTTLNILDATGAPWPVMDVTWAGDFEIVEPEEGGHIIRITPMSHFARGNIVIRMLTLKTPLTMTLETGRDVVQYRVDARIPEYGPFASAPLMEGGKSLVAGDPELTSILDGVMPGGMSKLQVVGVDGRTTAYSSGGKTYVRTPLTLLSPAWQSSISSADGMNVYALGSAPVVLLSDGGQFVRATLKEKEDLLDE
ncbi:MAG: type IV secretion protein DotH [Micavibrio aeruginosavorus]|uniref:Type IV secretion protein DotH n=1 Tax=Micavibrio aeruginosavorus TaxID=349221 RepID=A0A2W5C0K6_9BACT|nr:MAG: type IV secretion protein DotH [Micavibrio aeruginosavorus]